MIGLQTLSKAMGKNTIARHIKVIIYNNHIFIFI